MNSPSTTEKGDEFEKKVYHLIVELVSKGEFGLAPKTSFVFWKKKYYSITRAAEIEFDISIESFLPGAQTYTTLHLFECKNYKEKVPVGDVEEFESRVRQVGEHNTKAYFVTNNYFQKSAIGVAKSYKIGLAILMGEDRFDWLIYRKDKPLPENNLENIQNILNGGSKEKYSFFGFLDGWAIKSLPDLLLLANIIKNYVPDEDHYNIDYLSSESIDTKIIELGINRCYDEFSLNAQKLCELISSLYDVGFQFDDVLGQNRNQKVLGKIVYQPLMIFVDKGLTSEVFPHRFRFTLCHEIGHLVLHSSLLNKYFDSTVDVEHGFLQETNPTIKTLHRLEIQANMFAAQVLLPTKPFKDMVFQYFAENRIFKGHLFLDWQRPNKLLVFTLLDKISQLFEVSREVAKIRLKGLKLLKMDFDRSINDVLRDDYDL